MCACALQARQQIASQLGAQRMESPSLIDSAPTDTEKPKKEEEFIDDAVPKKKDICECC